MTVFQTSEYRAAYAHVFGRGKRFLSVNVPGGAIYLQRRGLATKKLEFWAQGIADCGGTLIETPEIAATLWNEIEKIAARCHGAQLQQLAADSPLVPHALQAGWAVQSAEVCPVLTLPDSFDEYVKSLGKNMREQIKRYPKRLEKQFQVEYELARTPEEVAEFLEELFELHGRRWRGRGQTGVLVLPARRKFQRVVCEKFLRNDWLRLWRLKCDGKAVCVLLNYYWGGKYWFFIGGFDPDMMRWSVGTCLFSHIFQEAIAEGAREFDFLRGAEEYKYRFGAVDREFVNLSWFAATPRGKILKKRTQLESAFMHKVHERFGAG